MILHPLQFDELLTALPTAAAVLERGGRVVRVNEQWRSLLARVSGDADALGLGTNYLEVCGSANGVGAETAARAATGFRAIVAGELASFSEDYSWQFPDGEQTLRLSISPVGADRSSVLITNTNVTADYVDRERLAFLSSHDQLTGLPNRSLFLELFGQAVTVSARHDYDVVLLFCDVDGFQGINEQFGHQMGDELIRAVAARLKASLRPSDVVARFGGDEFLVMLPDVETMRAAELVAGRLVSDVSRPFRLHGRRLEIGLSVGMAFADTETDTDTVLGRASDALLRAKSSGKGRFVLAEDDAVDLTSFHSQLDVSDITEERLVSHFQPIVDLADGSVVGAEALLRWRHPHYGLLHAAEFLGLAVNSGHIGILADQALVCSTETWVDLRDQLPSPAPQLFLNISPDQLRNRGSVDRLRHVLLATGLPPEEVVLEITEEAIASRFDELVDILTEIRSQGIRIALDDFGSGYSSLGRLRHLPVDVLKLDQSLVRGVDTDRRARQLLASIASMAAELEVECIVEGCETVAEAAVVGDIGFRYVQGFHFGRPVDRDAFVALLDRGSAVAVA